MSHFLHIPVGATPIDPRNDAVVWLDAGNTASWTGTADTTFADLSGNTNDIAVSGCTYNSAQGGKMIYDGVNDYCDGNISFTMTSGVVTFEMWFSTISENNTTWKNFLNYGNKVGTVGAGPRLFGGMRYLGNIANGAYRDTFYQAGDTEEYFTPNITDIDPGDWVHWVMARDNTNTKHYINGVLSKTTTHRFNPTDSYWTDVDLSLGVKDTISGYHNFASTITRLYEKKLSAAEALEIYDWEKARHGM